MPLVDQGQVDGWNGAEVARQPRHGGGRTSESGRDTGASYCGFERGCGIAEKDVPEGGRRDEFKLARPGLVGDDGRPVGAFLGGTDGAGRIDPAGGVRNLGSLFAARAADRSREIALRLALGSSRKRILRQLFTEAVLVSLMGGGTGLLGSVVLLRWLSVWQPVSSFPIDVPVSPDAHVYALALLLALASGFLFGVVPVRQVLRANPYEGGESGTTGVDGRRFTARDLLLVVQIAICAVLVTSSLVAVRGLVRSLHSDFGFAPQGAMLVDTDLDMAGYSGDQVVIMQRRAIDAVATIPGVTAAGLIDRPPLGMGWNSNVCVQGRRGRMKISNKAADAYQYRHLSRLFSCCGHDAADGENVDAGTTTARRPTWRW